MMRTQLITTLALMACAMSQGIIRSEDPASRDGTVLGIFADSQNFGNLAGSLHQDGLFIRPINAEELSTLDSLGIDFLIVGPEARVPPASRKAIHRFRTAGGNLAVLNPSAFQYPNRLNR